MKKIASIIILLYAAVFPQAIFAEEARNDIIFKAEIIAIVEEADTIVDGSKTVRQQNLLLLGLDGGRQGQEYSYNGIGNLDVIGKNVYKPGDKVLVVESRSDDGSLHYYISDYVRNDSITYLFFFFSIALIAIGRWKGVRALASLVLSFFVITYYVVPQILGGADAIIVTLIGSVAILFSVIYLTEGFKRNSHIASLSILISLIFTIALSWLFVNLAKLSGVGSEEIAFLVTLKDVTINFKGLLLSGIIIGTLGVLDDVIISQISTVEQLHEADRGMKKQDLYRAAYKVGISHISSMANTLFLAYAGASFPLLLLFFSGQSAFSGFFDVINNESIATEIVRTLAGSIGLIFAVPISTWLAVAFLKKSQ